MSRPAALAVAALLALNPIAHVVYLGWAPPAGGWWLRWLGLSALVYPVVWKAAAVVVPHLRAGGRAAKLLPIVAGVFVESWWHGQLADALWLHPPAVQAVLGPLVWLAHATLVAAVVAVLLAVLIATDPPPEPTEPRSPTPWAAVAVFTVAGCLFAAWYVGREQTLYGFDSFYYWDRAAGWAGQLRADPPAALAEFRRSVQSDSYTLLPVLPQGLAMAGLSDHRVVYELATVVAYLPPLALAGVAVVRRLAPGRPAVAPTLLLIGLFPGTWLPLLHGMPDVGGAALAAGTLAVYLARPAGRLRWGHLLGLVVLLAALVLFRRWYAFWVVAFGLLVGADGLVGAIRHRRDWRVAARCLRPAIAIGVLLPLVLAAVALPGVKQMAGGEYVGRFTAYKAEVPLAERLEVLARGLGPVFVVATGLAALALLVGPGRRAVLLTAGMVPVMVAHFMRVQDFNPHHQYLLLPAVTLLPAAALARLPRVALVPVVVVAVALFAPVVSDDAQPLRAYLGAVANPFENRPARRNDLPEVRHLVEYLNARPAGEQFVVLASSERLHNSMVAGAGRVLRVPFPATARQLPLEDVDRVYGFPAAVLRADLVLVADPPQIHLRPAEQQTVLVPARQLLTGTGIGAAFDRLPDTFTFDGGVTLWAFHRARPIPPAAVAALADELRQAHPDLSLVFTPPPDLLP